MKKGGKRDHYGTCVPRKELWKRKSSLTLRSLFTGKEISWAERQPQRLRQECSNQLAAGRMERDLHRWSVSPCCAPQPKMHVCWCAEELSAETQASGDRPGGRTGVGCAEPAWRGYSVGQTASRGCFQKEPRSEALLLTGTQRQGQEPRHSRLTLGVLTAGGLCFYKFGNMQVPEGGPHMEAGLKSEPVPRGHTT